MRTASRHSTDPPSVGAFEAKTRLGRLLEEVREGATLTITVRGKAVARLVPVDATVQLPRRGFRGQACNRVLFSAIDDCTPADALALRLQNAGRVRLAYPWYSTPAGIWYQYVSIPISQFIWLRWIVRLAIWWRFLWKVSRLPLNLVPTHPDRSCGLGFLNGTAFAMAPFLLAHSCLLSGYLGNRILLEGTKLPDYSPEIGILAAYLFVLTLRPPCVFTPSLFRAKVQGLARYGTLASEYVDAFDRKWIGAERPPDEPLMGSADIQSLADLANSFGVVQSIIPFPFGRSSLVGLVVVALPLLPLALTMLSLKELVSRLVQIVL